MQSAHTKLFNASFLIVPPPPTRFTLEEWHANNKFKTRICLDQQKLADRVLAESERVKDEVEEKTRFNKLEVDHQLEQKIKDIEFNKKEVEIQRKEVCIEIDNLLVYMDRIRDCLASSNQAGQIVKKCLILREERLGIDLCFDDAEREMKKELDVIEGAQTLMTRLLEQSNEQVRRLRSTMYFIDRDLEDKGKVIQIDGNNLILNENSLNLSMYHGFAPLDASNITLEEWNEFTRLNIERSAKEITTARHLRSYTDTLLGQVVDDLVSQFHGCNEAFRGRIEEIKEAKTKLEVQHSEVLRQVNEMTKNITELKKSIAEKEGYMALAHTRLGNRAQRGGIELCKDIVENRLVVEVGDLRENVCMLQQMMTEAQASLRYLLKTQIQLEEDINIKTNTLKIDEVDCMTLRESIDYHAF